MHWLDQTSNEKRQDSIVRNNKMPGEMDNHTALNNTTNQREQIFTEVNNKTHFLYSFINRNDVILL